MSDDNETKDAFVPGPDSNSTEFAQNETERLSAREIFKASQTEEQKSTQKNTKENASDNTNSVPPEAPSKNFDEGVDTNIAPDDDIASESENIDDAGEIENIENTVNIESTKDIENIDDLTNDTEETDDDNILFLEKNEEETPEEILLSRLESLIFIYPEPITVRRLAKHLSISGKRVRELIEILTSHYADRGINLNEISGGFQFHTSPDNAEVIRSLTKVKPMKMSRPALETLAIVAYKQPCTRAEVEDVRRVDCGGTLKFLFEKELVRVLGRKEEPGRPIIYGTSSKFLELFNLKSLTDLPSLHEYTELWDEHKDLVDENDTQDEGQILADTPGARQQTLPVDSPSEIDQEDTFAENTVEDENADDNEDTSEESDKKDIDDDAEDGIGNADEDKNEDVDDLSKKTNPTIEEYEEKND